MSILDNLKRFVQPYSDDEEYDDYEDEEMEETEQEEVTEAAPRTRRPSPFSTPMGTEAPAAAPTSTTAPEGFKGHILNMDSPSGKQDVVLFHAKSFESAAKAADELRRRKAVILNMENVDKALTRRVVDFLSGAVYALDGNVKKIAQSTYLFCPHNMNVVGDLENVPSELDSYV